MRGPRSGSHERVPSSLTDLGGWKVGAEDFLAAIPADRRAAGLGGGSRGPDPLRESRGGRDAGLRELQRAAWASQPRDDPLRGGACRPDCQRRQRRARALTTRRPIDSPPAGVRGPAPSLRADRQLKPQRIVVGAAGIPARSVLENEVIPGERIHRSAPEGGEHRAGCSRAGTCSCELVVGTLGRGGRHDRVAISRTAHANAGSARGDRD